MVDNKQTDKSLKKVNQVIVISYLIGSLIASFGFSFIDIKLLFYLETILGLLIYLCGAFTSYVNYKKYRHASLLILMIAGMILSISLIVMIL